jgi:hypothetical protein
VYAMPGRGFREQPLEPRLVPLQGIGPAVRAITLRQLDRVAGKTDNAIDQGTNPRVFRDDDIIFLFVVVFSIDPPLKSFASVKRPLNRFVCYAIVTGPLIVCYSAPR